MNRLDPVINAFISWYILCNRFPRLIVQANVEFGVSVSVEDYLYVCILICNVQMFRFWGPEVIFCILDTSVIVCVSLFLLLHLTVSWILGGLLLGMFTLLLYHQVGLPNVGKSMLFNTLTKLAILAENFPLCTIEPNEAWVNIPDERLEWLCKLYKLFYDVMMILLNYYRCPLDGWSMGFLSLEIWLSVVSMHLSSILAIRLSLHSFALTQFHHFLSHIGFPNKSFLTIWIGVVSWVWIG